MQESFSDRVVAWFNKHGRKHLPWQQNPTPYHVWVSEIMLQQTQVATVTGYYERFIKRFPDVESLAAASQDEVLAHWAGLGYYARGRNLHKSAQIVALEHQGSFPASLEDLMALPGVGRSTAGAIRSLGHLQPGTILDGNVKRVLARVHAIDKWPDERETLKKMWILAESLTPNENVQAYNQAMMDIGALICTRSRPSCDKCPLTAVCQAYEKKLTGVLPVSKPKKIIPEKSGQMLILRRKDGAILLQKRPSPGIWGGLWSFPEALPWEIQPSSKRVLGHSRHTFTHYRWNIALELWETADLSAAPPGYLWYTGQAQPLGLAAIVKRFLPLIE